jgi:hypothetical protein
MHSQGYGRPNSGGGRRHKQPGAAPKQRWEGLPKDEDEPK